MKELIDELKNTVRSFFYVLQYKIKPTTLKDETRR